MGTVTSTLDLTTNNALQVDGCCKPAWRDFITTPDAYDLIGQETLECVDPITGEKTKTFQFTLGVK
jgi:hypothetical protein